MPKYDKLFRKLESLNLTPKVVDWFKSYLQGRKQCVEIENNRSEMLDIRLGVPQGSVLGPILFLIYVNDINNCDNTVSFTKFADDATVLASAPTLREPCTIMNKPLINVNLWFQRNKLNLIPSKTRYIIFNCNTEDINHIVINGTPIQRVWKKGKETQFKLMGIQVDKKLTWRSHIDYISREIDYANYSLGKAGKELNPKNKKASLQRACTFTLSIWLRHMGDSNTREAQ